jgi:SAM-dependent methyltransferase
VKHADAVELLDGAVPHRPGVWADLGAGDGTFTRALAELLGRDSRIYAVDRDAAAIGSLARWAAKAGIAVLPVVADFTKSFDLPGLAGRALDGILLANALHFVSDPGSLLARLAAQVRPGGRVVIVEYDHRRASRWVPYPIPSAEWPALAETAGLAGATIAGSRPSAFGGSLYVAAADRPMERLASP